MFLLDFACTRFIENMEKSLDITAFSLSLLIGNICTGPSPKGEAGGSIPFWRAKNPGNRLISGIFIDDAKYNIHKKAPGVELQEAAARRRP